MEIVRDVPRGRIRSALFDFDGTLSLLREGWQGIMVSFMVEELERLQTGESAASLQREVVGFITELTGKQTIYQMIRLAEEVAKRGGRANEPLEYKRRYHDRLWGLIRGRIERLRRDSSQAEDWLVAGSRPILEGLRERGIRLYLASGTDEEYVLQEARLLGIDGFFGEHIYGAQDDYLKFSKRRVIARILEENNLHGPEFVSFGDGYVEIENTREVDGIAVGVASDEALRCGIDEWKRSRLLKAGADIIVPDFRGHRELLDYLFPSS